MRSERIPFVVRFVRVTGKGRPLQGGCSFLMRFRLEGFSLSFLAWEKPFFFAPFIPLSRGLWYTGAQGGRMQASRRKRRRPGTKGPLNERGRKPRRFPTLVMDGGIRRWACRLKRNGRKWKTAATNETKRCWGCAFAANGGAASLHAERRRRLHSAPSLPWMRAVGAPPDRSLSAALAPDSAGTTGGKAVAVMQTRPVSRRTCAQGISFTYAMEAGSSAIGVPAGGEEAAGQSAGKEGG